MTDYVLKCEPGIFKSKGFDIVAEQAPVDEPAPAAQPPQSEEAL